MYKKIATVGVGILLSLSGALTASAQTTTASSTSNTATSNDFTKGTYYYYFNSDTGQKAAVADPAAAGTGAATTPRSVSSASTTGNDYSKGVYFYSYTTDGTGLTGSNTGTALPLNGSVAQVTSGATPGLPNTGAGGDAAKTFGILGAALLACLYGSYSLTREWSPTEAQA